MCTGITDNPCDVTDPRKTAIIDRELTRLDISIAALQETRLAGSGTIREENFTFFWKGRDLGQPRQHGVGFAINNALISATEPPTDGTERLLSLRLNSASGPVVIINAYAPTLAASDDAKDDFYGQLDKMVNDIHQTVPVFILGDFNARIGVDFESWPTCIGHFGTGKINENGQRLLEL